MPIEYLEITHLRNLDHVCITPAPHLNLITGKNGSGKTSLLEAIHVLGTGRSFRTSNSSKLINFQQTQFVVFGRVGSDDHGVPIGISKSKKETKIRIANQPAKSSSQLAEQLAVQIVNPDAHKLLEEGPRYRRRFVEWGVFHVEQKYFPLWQECRHVLKQRNAALKAKVPQRELRHWDKVLIEKALRIDKQRRDYLNLLQDNLNTLLKRVEALGDVKVMLDSGWPKEQALNDALIKSRVTDYEKGFTRYGPHRLDLRISVNGIPAKDVVSRGQQKLLTALLKIAQVKLLSDIRPTMNTVLLVDDLPAELDEQYRMVLLDIIIELGTQVFVTGTDKMLLPTRTITELSGGMFHVEQGNFTTLEV